MAKEIDQKQLDKLAAIVKKQPGNSERFYSEQSGIKMSQILRYLVLAELIADPSLKIPATGPSIVKARNSGLRWPRIAARAGISVSKAQELFEENSGTPAAESYAGRGRNFSTSPATGGGKTRTTTRTSASKTGTSGRRGAAKKTAASKTKTVTRGRRGTRAGASPK